MLRGSFFRAFFRLWRNTPRPLRRLAIWVAIPRAPVGAAILLFDAEGRILLVRTTYERGPAWTLPGGWAKRGEELDDAARREAREELGIEVVVGRPLAAARGPFREVAVAFEATWAGAGDLGALDPEIAEARFFALNDLPPLFGPARRLVRDGVAALGPAGPAALA